MDRIRIITAAIVLLLAWTTLVHASDAGIEWDILNKEAIELYLQGRYERAIVVAGKALEVANDNVGPDHPAVATSLNNLAEFYRTLGDYAKAETLFKRSLAIKEKAFGPDHPSVATSLENMAALYRATKRDDEAMKLEKRAEDIRAIER